MPAQHSTAPAPAPAPAPSALRPDTGQMPFPVRLLVPLPFTVTGVQHGSAFMLRLTLLTLLSLGRSTYLHWLMRYMGRVRLKYLTGARRLEGWGVQIKLSARGSSYAVQLCCHEVCTRPARAYMQIEWEAREGGRVGGRYADDRTITILCAERTTLHKQSVPAHHARSHSGALGLR